MTVHVVHVITSLHTGGAEAMLARLVMAAGPRPVRASVVSLLPGGAVGARLAAAGHNVADIGMRRGLPSPLAVMRLASLLRRLAPDVVQSWMYHADLITWLALYLSGLHKTVPLYWGVRCSNMDTSQYGVRLRLVLRACARLSPRVTGVVANSFAGRDYHQRLGYAPPTFAVIVNGIDTDVYHPPSAATRAALRAQLGLVPQHHAAAVVARVDPMKGHEVMVAAMAQIAEARGLFIGAGTERFAAPNCIALGRRDDVPALLGAADAIVSSSHFGEGFSNAVAEGMAAGLVPVVTDVGDSARIVGDTGLVVPPGDAGALREALRRVFAWDIEERQRRGRAARARIQDHFGIEQVVRAFDALHTAEL